jgi:aspartate dehydrogenase
MSLVRRQKLAKNKATRSQSHLGIPNSIGLGTPGSASLQHDFAQQGNRNMLDIAIIGHGAIAGFVAKTLHGHEAVRIACAISRPGREAAARELFGADSDIVTAIADAPPGISLAVDCAGHAGLAGHGPEILARGIDLVTVSSGALADAGLAAALEDAARAGGARLQIAPGAVGAIDALAAARLGGLDVVTYVGRKPPAGWKGSPAEEALDLDHLEAATTHFEGSARDAALRYPKNANVAATIALAGIGLDATSVELIADPAVTRNCHEIHAAGGFGSFKFEVEGNTLPESPRTSALAAMSAAQAVLSRVNPIVC